MQKSVFIFVLYFASYSLSYSQWEILNKGLLGGLNQIEFVNDYVGFSSGWGNSFLKTEDGGNNWFTVSLNGIVSISKTDFINESIGWAIGSSMDTYGIWKTTDGGNYWFLQKSEVWFDFIFALNENNIYAAGSGTIYRTSNGGSDWDDVSPNIQNAYFNDLYFSSAATGVVVGNYYDDISVRAIILRTTNGGDSWEQTLVNQFNNITNLQFLNNTSAYFKANKDTLEYLCKTENFLDTWEIKLQTSYWISTFYFLDENVGYANIMSSISTQNLQKTTNGGISWNYIKFFDFIPEKIYFNNSNGFIIGRLPAGTILLKNKNGDSEWEIKEFSYPVNEVHFLNQDVGFLMGGIQGAHLEMRGDIFSTKDGGKKWDLVYSIEDIKDAAVFKSSYFFDEFNGLLLGSGRPGWGRGEYIPTKVFKTIDKGESWNKSYQFNYSDYSFSGNDMTFINDQLGWAVGGGRDTNSNFYAVIFESTDKGENWKEVWKDTMTGYEGIKSIHCDDGACWAAGENGLVLNYTSGNKWQKISSFTDLPLTKVFSKENNVWIAAGYDPHSSLFFRSTDYGKTWIEQKISPYLINDLYFSNNDNGLAVGYDSSYMGIVLKTENSGKSWNVILDSLSGTLNSIFIRDKYGWASGNNGLVIRTTDNGITWVDDRNGAIHPGEFKLEQNYPNPFNPVTKINYTIPVRANIELKVFDILGKEVAVLINEEKAPGIYEVEFNGSILSSGVYFIKLSTDGKESFSDVKKMILIK